MVRGGRDDIFFTKDVISAAPDHNRFTDFGLHCFLTTFNQTGHAKNDNGTNKGREHTVEETHRTTENQTANKTADHTEQNLHDGGKREPLENQIGQETSDGTDEN